MSQQRHLESWQLEWDLNSRQDVPESPVVGTASRVGKEESLSALGDRDQKNLWTGLAVPQTVYIVSRTLDIIQYVNCYIYIPVESGDYNLIEFCYGVSGWYLRFSLISVIDFYYVINKLIILIPSPH
jgi:hypothetical protein